MCIRDRRKSWLHDILDDLVLLVWTGSERVATLETAKRELDALHHDLNADELTLDEHGRVLVSSPSLRPPPGPSPGGCSMRFAGPRPRVPRSSPPVRVASSWPRRASSTAARRPAPGTPRPNSPGPHRPEAPHAQRPHD